MVEEKEREKPKQVRKRIEPMLFYDKSKLVDPMEEVKHDPQNLPKSREQFWAEMEAKFRTPSEKASVPEPAGQPQAPAVSKEKIAQVLGISNQGAVQQMPANMSGVIANQDGTVAPKLDISLAEVSAGKKEGPTPLDLVKKLKRHVSMCVVDGKLYVYSHGYYQMMTQNDMETEIWAICRQEVEQTGSKSILTGAYQLLLVDPDLTAARLLPADNLVPLRNGLLRLDDGAFLMHSPACFLTFVLQCDYTPSYGCPVFEQYLNDVTAGDPLLIARIWEFIGCCLTQVDIKTIFVLQGVPSSGKSALINAVKTLYPKRVQSALDAHDLGDRFAMGDYQNKMLCVSSDMPAEALNGRAVSNLKKLSGRDTVSSDVKYGSRREFRFSGRIVLVTNNPLLLKQDDPAFWDRIVAIPFLYKIPKDRQDRDMENKLRAELPAIAYRAMNAFFRLRSNHYRFSGDYPINCGQLYSECVCVADPTTLIFLFLQKYFERGVDDELVVVDHACEAFNSLYHMGMSPIQFSAMFCQQAAQMYGAEKVRSRAGVYKNAKSCLKGIRYRTEKTGGT